jgi:two-component system, OmpR family, phosphate regulon sensor histidine kinase PhoR
MTGKFKKNPTSRLRAIQVYLLIVLLFTLVLFAVNAVSLQEARSISGLTSALSDTQAKREIWFKAISIFMILSVLGLGLFLFVRVSWDIRWFELRSHFISGVSHEFKTPLSLIRLYSETLAENEQEFSSEDRQNYIRIIARESERLSRLINNVLAFSKMEQVKQRYELPEGDLAPIISQAAQDYSDYILLSGFDLKLSIQKDLPSVRFNHEQVSQMILNLLDNARKYSGRARLIRLFAWVRFDKVVIGVQDNGIGISTEEQENIFQPFYRISSSGDQGGCGLGLYLVAQIMKEHGGSVEVESDGRSGSLFRLVFPVSDMQRIYRPSMLKRFWGSLSFRKESREIL